MSNSTHPGFFDYANQRIEENAAIQKLMSGESLTSSDSVRLETGC
jgi:hypothetical protein